MYEGKVYLHQVLTTWVLTVPQVFDGAPFDLDFQIGRKSKFLVSCESWTPVVRTRGVFLKFAFVVCDIDVAMVVILH